MNISARKIVSVPRFSHDCKECKFTGCYLDIESGIYFDAYIANHGPLVFKLGPSVIARYGSAGHEYLSAPKKLIKKEHGILQTILEDWENNLTGEK